MLEINNIQVSEDRTYCVLKLTNGEEVRLPAGYAFHAVQLIKSPPRVAAPTICRPCTDSNWKPTRNEENPPELLKPETQPESNDGSPGTPEST